MISALNITHLGRLQSLSSWDPYISQQNYRNLKCFFVWHFSKIKLKSASKSNVTSKVSQQKKKSVGNSRETLLHCTANHRTKIVTHKEDIVSQKKQILN